MGFWHKKTAKIARFMTSRVKMAEKVLAGRACFYLCIS